MISIEDFAKAEIKIAKIKEVEDHPNADRLYVVKIDLGEEERQIVAGIKSSYEKEYLIGKLIAVVTNLEPATIRGVESNGMLLAASDENGAVFLSPKKKVKLGSRVK